MNSEEEILIMQILKRQMDYYKSKLTDKYNRSHSMSKKTELAGELIDFSFLYKSLFGHNSKFDWDNDKELIDFFARKELNIYNNFIANLDDNNDLFLTASENAIVNFEEANYPFYEYNTSSICSPRMDIASMMNIVYEFLKSIDYDIFLDLKERITGLELFDINLENNICGAVYKFSALNKNFILLNEDFDSNIFKFQTIAHEYGHIFEMELYLGSNNNFLSNKSIETPFSEVISSFFEYAFLNYLKENKIYTNFTNSLLDCYYKDLLSDMLSISLISSDYDLCIDEDGCVTLNSDNLIKKSNLIKEKLNYYQFPSSDKKINFRNAYIYGIGSLFSIYLYENYKENPNFLKDLKKALLNYPITNDISSFSNLGINEEELLRGNKLKKVLSKYKDSL